MRRIYWTVDLMEAHVVAALLSEQGVPAWIFDSGMVRQDWFKALAFGGYRVVVAPARAEDALPIVAGYRNGDFALADAADDMPACPKCANDRVIDDPLPRRAFFLALIVPESLLGLAFAIARVLPTAQSGLLAFYLFLRIAIAVPGVAAFAMKHRYVCRACAHRFRYAPDTSFNELARRVSSAAESAGGDPH